MVASIPVIEVADERDAHGRRRPDRERHALHPAEVAHVRSEFLVHPVLVALVEEVKVLLAQGRQETVRVEKLPDLAVGPRGAQLITKDALPARDENLEEPRLRHALHRDPLRRRRLQINNLASRHVAEEGTRHHAFHLPARHRVHPEDRVRGRMTRFQQQV